MADDWGFLSHAIDDSVEGRRVGAFLEKLLEDHGHKLVSELPNVRGDLYFLDLAKKAVSGLTLSDVQGAQIAVQSERPPATIERELSASNWGPLVKALKDNGLNAGEVITIVLALITIILTIRDNSEPPPPSPPAPTVEVNVEIPTEEIIRRVTEEVEKRQRKSQPTEDD